MSTPPGGYHAPPPQDPYYRKAPFGGLVRPRHKRWIAGVCAGLGRRFGMSPGTVRLLFVLSCLLPGPQFVVYIILWIMMPSE